MTGRRAIGIPLASHDSRLRPSARRWTRPRPRTPANYVVVGPRGHVVPVDSAVYDATTYTVTLHPHERLQLRAKYVLTINGTAPSGVASDAGALLDGTDSGSPGSDFVATAFWFHLKGRGICQSPSQQSTRLPKPHAVADQARTVSIVRSHRVGDRKAGQVRYR